MSDFIYPAAALFLRTASLAIATSSLTQLYKRSTLADLFKASLKGTALSLTVQVLTFPLKGRFAFLGSGYPQAALSILSTLFFYVFSAVVSKSQTPNISYSSLEQEAIERAKALLQQKRDTGELETLSRDHSPPFKGQKFQPINQDIRDLSVLYDVYSKRLKDSISWNQKGDNPWSHPKTLKRAGELMDIAFAIGCLTLEELDQLIQTSGQRTRTEALTCPESYPYHAFFFLPVVYRCSIRAGLFWGENPDYSSLVIGQDPFVMLYPHPIFSAKEHADRFFDSRGPLNQWRQLYNAYCDRVSRYVDLKDLHDHDPRFFSWIQPDLNETKYKFRHHPDLRPIPNSEKAFISLLLGFYSR